MFVCAGVTVNKFPLIVATKYNVPFLLNRPGTGRFIRGEVYEIGESMLAHLDDLEDYPQLYSRIIINVKGSDGYVIFSNANIYVRGFHSRANTDDNERQQSSEISHWPHLLSFAYLYNRNNRQTHDCYMYVLNEFPAELLQNQTFLEEYKDSDEQPYSET